MPKKLIKIKNGRHNKLSDDMIAINLYSLKIIYNPPKKIENAKHCKLL